MTMTAEKPAVRPSEAPPEDKDHLVHIFCTPCKKRAMARAKRPQPYCGKEMPNRPLGGNNPDLPVCSVCWEMAAGAPCKTCGMKAHLPS